MKAKPPFANIYWFPLAALYAALLLPWSVGGQLGWFPAPAGLQQAWGHGHEMIFGFALAVIAGYIAGPQPKTQVFSMLGLWSLARLSFWFAPSSVLSTLFNIAFAGTLVWKLAPIFLITAKKWRNKSVGLILVGLAIAAVGFHSILQSHGATVLTSKFLIAAVLLLSTLMFYMGGRILAPALAGHFRRHQVLLKDRVQPRFEGTILVLLFFALVVNFLPFSYAPTLMAAVLFICALLGAIRVLRWRPWWCYDRADLLSLLLGYSWLIVGWLYIGLSLVNPNILISQALHAITIGALGTLTLTVMARGRSHRVLRDPNAKPLLYILPLLLSAAAILRLSAIQLGYTHSILLASACWSAAFAGLFVWLLWLTQMEREEQPSA
jgi:uncharacterized protein involved in response to NO